VGFWGFPLHNFQTKPSGIIGFCSYVGSRTFVPPPSFPGFGILRATRMSHTKNGGLRERMPVHVARSLNSSK
jgi:hypothetical protein